MTYRELEQLISQMTEQEKDNHAVVYNWSDYTPVLIIKNRWDNPEKLKTTEELSRALENALNGVNL